MNLWSRLVSMRFHTVLERIALVIRTHLLNIGLDVGFLRNVVDSEFV